MSLMHEFAANANKGEPRSYPTYIEFENSLFQNGKTNSRLLGLTCHQRSHKNEQYREFEQFLRNCQKGHNLPRQISAACAFEVDKVARALKSGAYDLMFVKREIYSYPSSQAGHLISMAFFSYSTQSRTLVFTGFLRTRLRRLDCYTKLLSQTDTSDSGILVYSKQLQTQTQKNSSKVAI